MKQIAYLGPKGTFTEEAASKLEGKLIPYETIYDILDVVNKGKCDFGVVPIENSIEGSVGVTLDLLAHTYDLKIIGELILPIKHHLLTNPGAKLENITTIYSHAQPLAQCRNYLTKLNKKTFSTTSTALAAKTIKNQENLAAIGNKNLSKIYDLEIIAENIQDVDNNQTRFIILSKTPIQPEEDFKTSIIISLKKDKPGALYDVLCHFTKSNINLTKIESRPSKKGLGNYIFFIDFECNNKNDLKNVLNNIKTNISFIKILGSYKILWRWFELAINNNF